MTYGRNSATPVPNVTLFSLCAGEGESARDDWSGPRGDGVGMTRIGGVRVLRSVP